MPLNAIETVPVFTGLIMALSHPFKKEHQALYQQGAPRRHTVKKVSKLVTCVLRPDNEYGYIRATVTKEPKEGALTWDTTTRWDAG